MVISSVFNLRALLARPKRARGLQHAKDQVMVIHARGHPLQLLDSSVRERRKKKTTKTKMCFVSSIANHIFFPLSFQACPLMDNIPRHGVTVLRTKDLTRARLKNGTISWDSWCGMLMCGMSCLYLILNLITFRGVFIINSILLSSWRKQTFCLPPNPPLLPTTLWIPPITEPEPPLIASPSSALVSSSHRRWPYRISLPALTLLTPSIASPSSSAMASTPSPIGDKGLLDINNICLLMLNEKGSLISAWLQV